MMVGKGMVQRKFMIDRCVDKQCGYGEKMLSDTRAPGTRTSSKCISLEVCMCKRVHALFG